ncbi:unnamed protein product [Gongylonema pulchrum]|uniref:Zinc transporter ZIP11 n=1 Tax=Gongylonema pulchrum TaxID=637853 RepID=A0A183DRD3_9BILA|nr:unnamed protein product [Gongylonema pulchrum]
MIRSWDPISQAFVASMFTWGVTALGAAVVFLIPPYSKKLLDVSLGFAAGVMTAASFWSLLAPAIQLAESTAGAFAFLPVGIGFAIGAAFVYTADRIMPSCVLSEMSVVDMLTENTSVVGPESMMQLREIIGDEQKAMIRIENGNDIARYGSDAASAVAAAAQATTTTTTTDRVVRRRPTKNRCDRVITSAGSWPVLVLLFIRSIGKAAKATFETAFTLALGIGLQNFPEGLAVSLPLAGFGHTKLKAFFYGQLSGMVEPIAALAGAAAVILMEPVLPYALSFAAGAMIYVVMDDIIPEAQRNGNGKLASLGAIAGFLIMMSLDVGLGT